MGVHPHRRRPRGLALATPADPASAAAHTHRLVATFEQGTPTEAEAFFEAARHLPFTATEIATAVSELPLTSRLADRWPDKPLSAVGVLLTIHHMRDFPSSWSTACSPWGWTRRT